MSHGMALKSQAGKVVEYSSQKGRLVIIDKDGKRQSFFVSQAFKGPSELPEGTEVTIFIDSDSSTVTKILPKTPIKETPKPPKGDTIPSKPQGAIKPPKPQGNQFPEYRTSLKKFNALEERRISGEQVYKVEEIPSGTEIRLQLEGELSEARKRAGLSNSSIGVPRGSRARPIGPSAREISQGGGIDFTSLDRIQPFKVRRPTDFGEKYFEGIENVEESRGLFVNRERVLRRSDILSAARLSPGTNDSDTTFAAKNAHVSVSGSGSDGAVELVVVSIAVAKADNQLELLNDIETCLLVDTYSRCFISDWASGRLGQSSDYGLPPTTLIVNDGGQSPSDKWEKSIECRACRLLYGDCKPLDDPMGVSGRETSITFVEFSGSQSLLWRVSLDDEASPQKVMFVWCAKPKKSKRDEILPVKWARLISGSNFDCGLSISKEDQEKLNGYGLRKIKHMSNSNPIEALGMYLLDVACVGSKETFDQAGLRLETILGRLDDCDAESITKLFEATK